MVFLFETLKKQQDLEKKDYWQNRRESLRIESSVQNKLHDKGHVPKHEASVYKGLADQIPKDIAACCPLDGDVSTVAKVVDDNKPFGKRQFHHEQFDPGQDYGEGVNAVANRFRAEFLPRTALENLLALPVN
jgi:hypothetical protein